jgi:hypothetical protein
MTTWEMIAQKAKELPPEKQRQVLDFVDFVRVRSCGTRPLRSPEGLWADMGFDITEEDIARARREMWGNFPREDV